MFEEVKAYKKWCQFYCANFLGHPVYVIRPPIGTTAVGERDEKKGVGLWPTCQYVVR